MDPAPQGISDQPRGQGNRDDVPTDRHHGQPEETGGKRRTARPRAPCRHSYPHTGVVLRIQPKIFLRLKGKCKENRRFKDMPSAP